MNQKLIILCISISMFTYSYAQNNSSKVNEILDQLMEEDGIYDSCEIYRRMLSDKFDKVKQEIDFPEHIKIEFEKAINDSFNPHKMQEFIKDYMNEKLSFEVLSTISKRNQTPLGKKIVEARKAGNDLKNVNKIKELRSELLQNEKLTQIKMINDCRNGTRVTLVSIILMQTAMTTPRAMLSHQGQDVTFSSVYQQMTDQLNPQIDKIEQEVLATMVFIYKDLLNNELDEEISFLKSEEFKKYIEVKNDALISSIHKSANEFTFKQRDALIKFMEYQNNINK